MLRLAHGLLRSLAEPLQRSVRRVALVGDKRYCPVCRGHFRRFLDYGDPVRVGVHCPSCGSLERHRLLWRYLEAKTDFFRGPDRKMLHVAPEPCLGRRFRRQMGRGYLGADVQNPSDVRMDLANIQFADASFDIVYCSHVLERVVDDRQAMRELCRVLKPSGYAIIMEPTDEESTTVEDSSIVDPRERLRLFGQADHVRRYGHDFVDRLRTVGFEVATISADDFLSPAEIERIAVPHASAGAIFHCTRARATHATEYWSQRADTYGKRAVLDVAHPPEAFERITRKQKEILLPLFRASLRGSERTVLDFGCGPGRFTDDLAGLVGGRATGVDAIPAFFAMAPPSPRVEFIALDAGRIPMADRTVDAVWICLVLGGLDDLGLRLAVSEVRRVLRPGGLVFLVENTSSLPDSESWRFRTFRHYQKLFGFAPLEHLRAYDDLGQTMSVMRGYARETAS